MPEPLLRVSDLTFSYGSLQVLFDTSLHVEEGEILALLGTNGAGKSTLLRLVTGLEIPDSGRIEYQGRDMTQLRAEERVRAGLVLVPGGHALFPALTVEENLRVGAATLGRSGEQAERIEEAYELFGVLRDRRSQTAVSLSGGEQQMLALAKGLLLRPRLLAIDELSLGLAPRIVEQLLDVVAEINRSGTSIVLVEQSISLACEVADRAVFLEKGNVRYEGPAADLLTRDDLLRSVLLGSDAS